MTVTKYRRAGLQYDNNTSFETWLLFVQAALEVLEKDVIRLGQLKNTVQGARIWVEDDHVCTAQVVIDLELKDEVIP